MSGEFVKVRKELVDRLETELVGPDHKDEIIQVKPLQKYLCGILWPMKSNLATLENETHSAEGKATNKEAFETLAPLAKAMNPSAIGLSFLVDQKNSEVSVTVRFGMYEDQGDKESWLRKSFELNNFKIDFSINTGKRQKQQIPDSKNIFLEWLVRPYRNLYAVSMFLVNRNQQNVDDREIDDRCVFQPEIILEGNKEKPFAARRAFFGDEMKNNNYYDEDTLSSELLYRNESVFAVGHSIGVHWEDVSEDVSRAGKIFTKVIPVYEIPMVLPPEWEHGGSLDMRELANCKSPADIKKKLSPLNDAYENWIEERKKEIPDLDDTYRSTAERHIRECENSLQRMRKGIEIIEQNKVVFKSFKFANEVMSLQLSHTVAAKSGKTPVDIKTVWRPFQLAFILQNLEGVVDPVSEDRKIADLLWFPTGGGKTEAYLGLAAFTMGYRRMRKESGSLRKDAGVSVIMRYTLRLLTVQQFQRAAAMISACEIIRRKSPEELGETPFRIGLWVGEKSAPNNFDDAASMIQALRSKATRKDMYIDQSKGTPVQLVSCPWCGHALIDDEDPKLVLKSYRANKTTRRVIISCPNKSCEFHTSRNSEGIPVVVTDEEIYRLLPDLVIGTVDKIARMPWKPEIQNLFGKVRGEVKGWGFVSHGKSTQEESNIKNVAGTLKISDDRNLYPPELIIQDELHLISGPLGTMVGLYETAVDYLSSVDIDGKKIGPKVVASTATIRNADHQIKGLFTRKASIFPAQGLSHTDSFFARQQPLDKEPGRLYVGIFAPGRSMKTALLRVYANLLASKTDMEGTYSEELLDPYHTLVGYFNSLRELGGAVRLIEDDVMARMHTLEKQNKENNKYQYKVRDYERDVPELTSRIESSEIPKILKRLEQPFYKNSDIRPIDVLLASNMISVGVDVSRLGLMVVNGQPKTTAEYIQSTSRVGRTYPGLVVTVYNWIRPRDISHYEEFYAYHAAIYRYVEPISVTPFASRARDRGLAGTMVSMARLHNRELTPNSAANQLNDHTHIAEELVEAIKKRANNMNVPADEVLKDLKGLFEKWGEAIEKSKVVYSYSRKKEVSNLLYPLGKDKGGYFKVPNSMRDVEETAGIYLRRG